MSKTISAIRRVDLPLGVPVRDAHWRAFLRPKPAPRPQMTMLDVCDQYEVDEVPRLNVGTARTMRSVLRQFRRDFGTELAAEFVPEYLAVWIEAEFARGCAEKTVRRNLYLRGKIFEYAVTLGACPGNPVKILPRSALPKNRVRDAARAALEVLLIEQFEAILNNERVPFARRLL